MDKHKHLLPLGIVIVLTATLILLTHENESLKGGPTKETAKKEVTIEQPRGDSVKNASVQSQNQEVSNNPVTARLKIESQPTQLTNGYWHWSGATEPYKVEALKLACKVSDCNLDFIRKIVAENGTLSYSHQSGEITKYGTREDSWGYCQMHRPSHPEIVNDSRFFTDPAWQMEQCYTKWASGTPMYAKPIEISQFTWVTLESNV